MRLTDPTVIVAFFSFLGVIIVNIPVFYYTFKTHKNTNSDRTEMRLELARINGDRESMRLEASRMTSLLEIANERITTLVVAAAQGRLGVERRKK